MKRWLALILALVLLMVCGCSKQEVNETTAATTAPTGPVIQRPPEPKPEKSDMPNLGNVPPVITIQNLPETVENPEGVPVLKWVCFVETQGGGETRIWNEESVLPVNEMLAQMDAPYRVQFQMVTVNRYLEPGQFDWFSQPEVQEVLENADLIYGYMEPEDRISRLLPITDYVVGEDAPLSDAVPHAAYWQATSHEGEIYGIPTRLLQQSMSGWILRDHYIQWHRLTEEELQQDFWEMDSVFERIFEDTGHSAFLDIPADEIVNTYVGMGLSKGYLPGLLSAELADLSLASCFILDYSSASPQVVNYLDMESVRQFCQAAVRYKKAGYIMAYSNIRYGAITFDDFYEEFPVTDATVKIWPGQLTTGISAGTMLTAEAVSLLELIAENEAFRKQLLYGTEGVDYTIVDGIYKRAEQQDGSDYSMDFLSPLSYFCGLTSDHADWYTTKRTYGTQNAHIPGTTGEEKLESHRIALEASRIIPPITVDLTDYEAEVTDVNYVLRRYLPYFSFPGQGFGIYQQETTEAVYEQMLLDLQDAGVELLQEELQEQVNAWLKENPILVK